MGQQLSVEILNYRKDGTPFWNRLVLIPIYGSVVQRDTGSMSRKKTPVREFLGVQQELPTNPVAGTAQQAALDAQRLVEPLSVVGAHISNELAHMELMNLMDSLSSISCDDWNSTGAHNRPGLACAAFALCNPNAAGIPLTQTSNDFLRLTGYTLEEATGQHISTVLRPQDTQVRARSNDDKMANGLECLRQLAATNAEGRAESRITRKMHCMKKDGTKWWCLMHASPVVDRKGKTKKISKRLGSKARAFGPLRQLVHAS